MSYVLSAVAIIDDDHVYQLVMKRTMEHTSLIKKVLQFYDGEEASEYFKEKQSFIGDLPEIILLDINMPFMNGWQFLDEFVKIDFKHHYNPGIFIVSSSSASEDLNKAKEYNMIAGYYVKPITKANFEEMVQLMVKAA